MPLCAVWGNLVAFCRLLSVPGWERGARLRLKERCSELHLCSSSPSGRRGGFPGRTTGKVKQQCSAGAEPAGFWWRLARSRPDADGMVRANLCPPLAQVALIMQPNELPGGVRNVDVEWTPRGGSLWIVCASGPKGAMLSVPGPSGAEPGGTRSAGMPRRPTNAERRKGLGRTLLSGFPEKRELPAGW